MSGKVEYIHQKGNKGWRKSDDESYTLSEVYKAGSNAFPVLNTDHIILKNTNKNDVEITTEGFNNFML